MIYVQNIMRSVVSSNEYTLNIKYFIYYFKNTKVKQYTTCYVNSIFVRHFKYCFSDKIFDHPKGSGINNTIIIYHN